MDDDIRLPVWRFVERAVSCVGSGSREQVGQAMVEAYRHYGVEVAPGTPTCKRMADRLVAELLRQGRLVKDGKQYRAVEWDDVAESPDIQVGPSGQVRRKDSGRATWPREDARGRQLMDLGKTYDVAKLTRLSTPLEVAA